MADGDVLAVGEADAIRESVDDLMARYDGTAHDDECETAWGPLCEADPDDSGWCAYHDDAHDGSCGCPDRARDEMDERPLELVAQLGSPFEIVLGVGGPDSRIVWDARYGTDSARLEVSWGSGDVIRRSEGIRAMAAYFEPLMEGETDD